MSLAHSAIAAMGVEVVLGITSIATTPYLLSFLETENYGVLGVVGVLLGQMSFFQFGVGPAVTRCIADARGKSDDGLASRYARSAVLIAAVGGLSTALAYLIGAPHAWSRFEVSSAARAGISSSGFAIAALFALQPPLAAFFGILGGHERFGALSLVRLVHGTTRSVAALVAAGVTRDLFAVLVTYAAVDAVALCSYSLAAWPLLRSPSSERWGSLKGILRLGIPLAAAGVVTTLLLDVEKLTIALSQTVTDFVYYNTPYNAIFRLAGVAGALVAVLVPRISFTTASGDFGRAGKIADQVTRLSTVGMSMIVVALIALVPELLEGWLGLSFAERAVPAARILLLGLLFYTAGFTAHSAIRARSHPLVLPALFSLELLLYAAVVVIAVREWGIVGAAAAWTIRTALDCLLQRLLATRLLRTRLATAFTAWSSLAAASVWGIFCMVRSETSLLLRVILASVMVAVLGLAGLLQEDRAFLWRTITGPPTPR